MTRLASILVGLGLGLMACAVLWLLAALTCAVASVTLALGLGVLGATLLRLGDWLTTKLERQRARGWRTKKI